MTEHQAPEGLCQIGGCTGIMRRGDSAEFRGIGSARHGLDYVAVQRTA